MKHNPNRPTPEQLAKEKAIFWSNLTGILITGLMMGVGLFSGAMTVLSEIARIFLSLIIDVVSWIVLRRSHRGQFNEYEYGSGKIERIVNLLVAFGLCISCMYILKRLFFEPRCAPLSATSLFFSIILADLNLILNVWFTFAFIRVNQGERSVIIESQIQSQLAANVASSVVLFSLILTLWLPDPELARMIDTLGSSFVVGFMLVISVGLIRESLPEILDRSVADPMQYEILRILAKNFDNYDGFRSYQTRRSGKDLFIQMVLEFDSETTLAEQEKRLKPIREDIAAKIPGAKVTIVCEILL